MEVLISVSHSRKTPRVWREKVRSLFVMVLVLSCVVWGGSMRGQEVSREYQLKAVLLYNLTQFVEWPPAAFDSPESPFVVCILGADPFGSVLDEAVRAERSNNRPIVVRRISQIEEAHDAQVVYFGPGRRRDLSEALERIRGRPVLAVGDFDGFLRAGGTVRMAATPDRKIKLRVNLESARSLGLTMSAKLLRVCTIVRAGEE